MIRKPTVRIGGASGAFIDSVIAVPQLLQVPDLDYLVFDYLGEGAMSLFARLKAADPQSGFLPDFVDLHIGPHLRDIAGRKIKVVANAGGLNPEGLAELVRRHAAEQGVSLRVATVTGDDLLPQLGALRDGGLTEMFSGAPFPDGPLTSFNAYLGAFPIAAALDAGADIVITGRVADSALILGALVHEFGWGCDQYDLLAAGTLAGHLIECGAQVTGGTFTDWERVPDWAEIGFPVAECDADGRIVITKPPNTGGLVSMGTVAEQMLYEVSDPQAYIVPDVVCDFSQVTLRQQGPDRVEVQGARGYPPTSTLKACATFDAGWRSVALIPISGIDAPAKARRQADALLQRCGRLNEERQWGPFTLTHVEVIGTEASYGPHARALNPREVLLKIVVDHPAMEAALLFGREQNTAIMNMAPGTSIAPIIAAPRAFPLSDMAFCLIDRNKVPAQVALDGTHLRFVPPLQQGFTPDMIVRPVAPACPVDGTVPVHLIRLAWARSGDKGRLFNVGVIARLPEYLPWIRAALTPPAVAQWFAHLFAAESPHRVDLFDVPGIHALNVVVHDAQGGGIGLSPRFDAAAKSMGQLLLEFPVPVPSDLARQLEDNHG